AVAGTTAADAFLQRFLASWLVVIAIGVPIGFVTGWLPPDRLVTFGFAVPIGAALGLVWVHRRLDARRWLAHVAVVLLGGWMIVGALLAWGRQRPFISIAEAEQAMHASTISRLVPPGTPIVLPVDDGDPTSTFLSARASNVARGALPSSRAGDVFVFVGTVTDLFAGRPTERGDPGYDAVSELTLAEIPDRPEPVVIVLPAFYLIPDAASDPRLFEFEDGVLASVESSSTPMPAESDDGSVGFGPSSGIAIALAAIAVLFLLTLIGAGYARVSFDDAVTAIATAPAFGAAGLSLVAVTLDRLGLRLTGVGVAFAATGLAGLGGLALLVVERKRDRQSPA
ncbi:MAG TPA: hypothetical protein VGZ51_01185, partial [Actinomycetota bacterium]|nr:hypothetical protein [Actinomycetota bacterium]